MANQQQNKDLENMLNSRYAGVGAEKKYKMIGKEIQEKSLAAGSSYEVWVDNASTFKIPSIKTAYVTIDSRQVLEQEQKNVGPNTTAKFRLTGCENMGAYVTGFFDSSGGLAFRIPGQGAMTAERASQENPNDRNPCLDVWVLQNA